jgi:hypothetical protein
LRRGGIEGGNGQRRIDEVRPRSGAQPRT